jgi:hypothetical protein
MAPHLRPKRTRLVAASIAGTLLFAMFAVLGAQPLLARQGFEQARARWNARPFSNYRLVAQDGQCTYNVLVRKGQVNAGLSDGCVFRARTVDTLFTIIERNRQLNAVCGPRGCLCQILTRVQASYHPELGYPTEIRIAAELYPNWSNPDVWRTMLATGRSPECGAASGRSIQVLAVEPLH